MKNKLILELEILSNKHLQHMPNPHLHLHPAHLLLLKQTVTIPARVIHILDLSLPRIPILALLILPSQLHLITLGHHQIHMQVQRLTL
jgi:hypothetical protein